MIKFADKSHIQNIIKLWDIAFPEDKKFNSYFFDNIFKTEYTLIMTEGSIVVSMLQMLPYKINGIGDVTYIYGAATDPLYRGKGYMKNLLEKSFEYDIKTGRKGSILIPAEKSLFEFYKKVGYKTVFYNTTVKYTNTEEYKYKFRPALYNDILNMKHIYKGDIIRENEYFKTQIDMFRALGGDVFVLYKDKELLTYSFVWNNENIEIQEIEGKSLYYGITANHIIKHFNKSSAQAVIKGNDNPFGMIKYHCGNKIRNMTMNLMYN